MVFSENNRLSVVVTLSDQLWKVTLFYLVKDKRIRLRTCLQWSLTSAIRPTWKLLECKCLAL
jgi:hypothetical protein